MSGLDILKHSWGMVWRNKADAARISVVLMIASIVISVALGFLSFASSDPFASVSPLGPLGDLFINIISLIIAAWIAVAWHRFVLLNEEAPSRWVPTWRGSEVLLYTLWIFLMGIGMLIALIPVFAVFIPVMLQAESQAAPDVGWALILIPVAMVLVTYLMIAMMRLSPVLVSRALGQKLSLKQAWVATRGTNMLIFGVFFWLFLIAIGVVIVAGIFVAILSAANLWVLLAGLGIPAYALGIWLMTLLQISIMTTIYGVYIEGRELPYSGGKLA